MTNKQQLALLGMKPIYGKSIPLTLDEITRIESLVGAELPLDYKDFISTEGCTYFPDCEVEVRPIDRPPLEITDTGLLEISSLLGGGKKGHRVLLTLELLQGRMPNSFVPFADDYSGNVFCLDVQPSSNGAVYFWSSLSEQSREDAVPHDNQVLDTSLLQNLTHVADSFSDFIMRLKKKGA